MIPSDPLRNLGPATILRADARTLPLADNSVDLIVTSPPYFALRSYQDAGEHYAGQIGSEATPAEFVDALIDCTREMMRALKPSGSIWVNLGDKYDSGTTAGRVNPGTVKDGQGQGWYQGTPRWTSGRPKSLLGIPWRYALRCIDDLGLILRAHVVWSKPNGLPESVTDRVRRSHEDWFHFTLSPRYYSAVDEIREPHADRRDLTGAKDRADYEWNRDASGLTRQWEPSGDREYNPLGKLPGSVWTIPTEPLRVPDHLGIDHFAAFPSAWPKRIIRGWSPAGVCTACREGRRPVVVSEYRGVRRDKPKDGGFHEAVRNVQFATGKKSSGEARIDAGYSITGYACACAQPTCDCGSFDDGHPGDCAIFSTAPTVPAIILDPFGGTGTVAMVARALGRHGIHADLSADYNRLAHWRITNLDQLAAVQGHQRTKRQPDDGDDLLTLLGGDAS